MAMTGSPQQASSAGPRQVRSPRGDCQASSRFEGRPCQENSCVRNGAARGPNLSQGQPRQHQRQRYETVTPSVLPDSMVYTDDAARYQRPYRTLATSTSGFTTPLRSTLMGPYRPTRLRGSGRCSRAVWVACITQCERSTFRSTLTSTNSATTTARSTSSRR